MSTALWLFWRALTRRISKSIIFKPNTIKIFKTTRIAVLRMKDYGRRNRAAQVSTMTGGKVNLKETEYKDNIDYIETDYHE